jgi:hypothetical protein
MNFDLESLVGRQNFGEASVAGQVHQKAKDSVH